MNNALKNSNQGLNINNVVGSGAPGAHCRGNLLHIRTVKYKEAGVVRVCKLNKNAWQNGSSTAYRNLKIFCNFYRRSLTPIKRESNARRSWNSATT